MAKLEFIPGIEIPGGRITQFVPPKPGMSYALGFDTSLGIEGKDKDAAEVFDVDGQQVLEAEGSWGETFDTILEPILQLYGRTKVFVAGERATLGLVIMRRLYDRGYWCYFQRDEAARGRPVHDRLGHAPGKNDITIQALQRAIAPRDSAGTLLPSKIQVYSSALHDQLCKYGFRPRSGSKTFDESRDKDLVMGAPAGEHDDLVRAAALAVAALDWLPMYDPPKETFPRGTYGAILNHATVDEEKQKSNW